MLELARLDKVTDGSGTWAGSGHRTLAVGLARTPEEVEQIQRLRYRVFTQDMGAVFPDAHDGIEQDRFDPWCEHLMVTELDTGRVVGTYRILTPEKAREAGGYYSESEFDLSGLGALRNEVVELGRSCTDATTAAARSSCCCGRGWLNFCAAEVTVTRWAAPASACATTG